jgi:hypothetical protein
MAVTLVQAPATGNTGGSGTSATATLGAPSTPGNQLILLCSYFGGNSGNPQADIATPTGYTRVYDNYPLAPAGNCNAVFQKTSAGEQSVTLTVAYNYGMTCFFVELAGVVGSPTGFLQANSATTSVLTDSTAGDLVMAMFFSNTSSGGGALTGWVDTFVNSVPFCNGDYQYYTGASTTTYQTNCNSALSSVIFRVPSTAGSPGNARITQEMLEAVQIPGTANARITQQTLEAWGIPQRPAVNARITQQTLEAWGIPQRPAVNARITQFAIEFLYFPLPTLPAISNTEWVYSTEIFF